VGAGSAPPKATAEEISPAILCRAQTNAELADTELIEENRAHRREQCESVPDADQRDAALIGGVETRRLVTPGERRGNLDAFLGPRKDVSKALPLPFLIDAGNPLEKVVWCHVEQSAELRHARTADAIASVFVFLDLLERHFDTGGYLLLAHILLQPKGAKIAADDLVYRLVVASLPFGHAISRDLPARM
jgi:hypothetical protein